jgi:homoserine dehydrogenase
MSASTSDLRVLKIGICGYGTVGRGTHDLLVKNESTIARRLDCIHLTVTHVASRSLSGAVFGVGKWSTDPIVVVNDPEVDIIVEAIGGLDTAFEVVKKALAANKNVVTANKALIATHGNELVNLASENGVRLLFESAVAGGIPIL